MLACAPLGYFGKHMCQNTWRRGVLKCNQQVPLILDEVGTWRPVKTWEGLCAWFSEKMSFATSVKNPAPNSCGSNRMHVNDLPLKGGCGGPFSYVLMSLLSETGVLCELFSDISEPFRAAENPQLCFSSLTPWHLCSKLLVRKKNCWGRWL